MSAVMGTAAPPEVTRLAALIREQADGEIEQITGSARERAQRLRAAAADEAAAIAAEARRDGEARGRRTAAALLAEAESRAQLAWLWAREHLLDDVLARVASQLAQLPVHRDSAEELVRLVEEGLTALPKEPVRVHIDKAYRPLVGLLLSARPSTKERTYRLEADAVPGGGVMVETEAGRLRFDHSLATRLRRLNTELRGAAATLLFAE